MSQVLDIQSSALCRVASAGFERLGLCKGAFIAFNPRAFAEAGDLVLIESHGRRIIGFFHPVEDYALLVGKALVVKVDVYTILGVITVLKFWPETNPL